MATGAALIAVATSMPSIGPSIAPEAGRPAPGPTMIEIQLDRLSFTPPICGYQGRVVDPGRASAVRYLPRAGVAGRPSRDSAVTISQFGVCPTASEHATWYRRDGSGRVVSRFEVDGPITAELDENSPFSRGVRGRPVRVGDGWGLLSRRSADLRLDFLGPQNSVWSALASGLTPEQVSAAVESLRLGGGLVADVHLDDARTPAGLTTRLPSDRRSAPGGLRRQLYARYGSADRWSSLTIEQGGAGFVGALIGSRPIDINGRVGWVMRQRIPIGYAERSGVVIKDGAEIRWEIADGVHAILTGVLSEDDAIAYARATVPIPADDPRLTH